MEDTGKLAEDSIQGGITRSFSGREQKLADYIKQTDDVDLEALPEPHTAVRTPDAYYPRVGKVELKGLDPGGDSNTVRNAVNNSIKRGGQARIIVIDARGSGLTLEEAERSLRRVAGIQQGRLDSLRIVGDGFDIKVDF
ncbi:MAG: hypothetical protein R3E39_12390 [Anaerolineae bacterium]